MSTAPPVGPGVDDVRFRDALRGLPGRVWIISAGILVNRVGAFLPVFIVLFDLGTQMQVASIIFSVIWPILLNTADGARSVTPLQMDTAEVFRLSTVDRIRYILIPSALPKIFAGLRLALSLSLILVVFSELLPGTVDGI